MLIIPHQELSPEAFQGLLESVVLREGTDYGRHETGFADKVAQLRAAVLSGRACIVFDAVTESVTILPADALDAPS